MRVLGHEPEGAREVRRVLDDQQPVRICARPVQLVDRGACVQRQRAVALGVGCGDRGGHHPGSELFDDGAEPTEVGRDVLDVGAAVAKEPLGRPEEPAAVVHARLHEHRVEVGQERAEQLEVDPVVTVAQRVQEPAGVSGAQSDGDAVGGVDGGNRLGCCVDPSSGHG